MKAYKLKDNFYWVGAVDWNLRDFHGYSTEKGSSYNAYLLIDKKITLFDTVKESFSEELIERVSSIIEPTKIDYLVVNHVEMDHSGALPYVINKIKPEKVICSAKAHEAIKEHFGDLNVKFEIVKTGDVLNTGTKNIQFIETPMLHWPDSMFSYIKEDKILISSDAFGQHFASSKFFDHEVDYKELINQAAKYYANILMPYSNLILKLFEAVEKMNLEISLIAPDHGIIWEKNIPDILSLYKDWASGVSKNKVLVIYDTMWKSTEKMAYALAEGIKRSNVEVNIMKLGENHRSDIVTELMFSKGFILGSATLNNEMLPRVADFTTYARGLKFTKKKAFCFNSYGWNPSVLNKLNDELKKMNLEVISDGVSSKYVPNKEVIDKCYELGKLFK